MFELDHAVGTWLNSVGVSRCGRSENQEELKDHLYCSIEAFIEQGNNEEQAFYLSIQQLGDFNVLKAEYAKNKSLFSFLWNNEVNENFENLLQEKESLDGKRMNRVILGNSIIWAAALIGSALLSTEGGNSTGMLTMMISLWFASTLLFGGVKNASKQECAYFRRKLGLSGK